jgi:hypothetical protein
MIRLKYSKKYKRDSFSQHCRTSLISSELTYNYLQETH